MGVAPVIAAMLGAQLYSQDDAARRQKHAKQDAERLVQDQRERVGPAPTAESGGDPADAMRHRRRRQGRASTVVAGDLMTNSPTTQSLLG